jgi:hypothetical protein
MLVNPPICWAQKSGNIEVRRKSSKTFSLVRASILLRPSKWFALNCSVYLPLHQYLKIASMAFGKKLKKQHNYKKKKKCGQQMADAALSSF